MRAQRETAVEALCGGRAVSPSEAEDGLQGWGEALLPNAGQRSLLTRRRTA